jgi:hypothetical protein
MTHPPDPTSIPRPSAGRARSAVIWMVLALVIGVSTALAQGRGRRGGGGWGGESYVPPDARTARDVRSHSTETPMWTNVTGFDADTFTFTRVIYDHSRNFGRGQGGGWTVDLPDSDLNLSYRLQQMTSMRVDPNGRLLRVTDPDLQRHPFIYIVEPGALFLHEEEILALRSYLENGGFLLMDDFWGELEWDNAAHVMNQVFPGKQFVELPLSHPLYSSVFNIRSKGQVPNVGLGIRSQYDPRGRTWEDDDDRDVHHRALFDDQGRLMVLALHNTDNGDGWEREGEDGYYFRTFSEPIAYPLGINIIVYVMTH